MRKPCRWFALRPQVAPVVGGLASLWMAYKVGGCGRSFAAHGVCCEAQ